MSKLDGRCLCGAVSYTSDAEPLFCAICHCTNCQRQTGTSFSIVVAVPEDGFQVTGELSEHATIGDDHGQPTRRRFCGQCGSPIVTVSDALPGVAIIKAGTLDDTSWLEPQLEIWGRSAQPWIPEVEGRPRLERSPQPG
jgi:hypothetical protein